jgi:hypothetical protein
MVRGVTQQGPLPFDLRTLQTFIWKKMSTSVSWCRQTLQRLIEDTDSLFEEDTLSVDTIEVIETQLELVYRELVGLEALGELPDSQIGGLVLCGEALEVFHSLADTTGPTGVHPEYEIALSMGAGRPRYDLPKNQLHFLLQSKFTIPQMASLLGVSVRTIRRRMEQYGLYVRSFYSSLSDQDLDDLVRSIQTQFGLCGNRQMSGHLLSRGIRVQQHRVRESQRRVDPNGCVMRRLTTINRRQYSVNGPLALWHIDGNHKLIR